MLHNQLLRKLGTVDDLIYPKDYCTSCEMQIFDDVCKILSLRDEYSKLFNVEDSKQQDLLDMKGFLILILRF